VPMPAEARGGRWCPALPHSPPHFLETSLVLWKPIISDDLPVVMPGVCDHPWLSTWVLEFESRTLWLYSKDFFFLLTWVFLIYISSVIPFPSFRANIPLIPPPPLLYGCSLPHPPPIAALSPTIQFTGGSVLAGPRASPSTGALTRIFITTYEVRVQGQSMYSL